MKNLTPGFFYFSDACCGDQEVAWDNQEHTLKLNLTSSTVEVEIQTEGRMRLPTPRITISSAMGLGWSDEDIPIYDASGSCVAHYNDQSQIFVVIGEWRITLDFLFFVSDLSFNVSTAVK